ncbi:hypothetical protein EsH8_II_001583 [Colletotrichum jinshuiense]
MTAHQTREAVSCVSAVEAIRDGGFADEKMVWVEIGPDAVKTSIIGKTLGARDSNHLLPTLTPGREDWAVLGNFVAYSGTVLTLNRLEDRKLHFDLCIDLFYTPQAEDNQRCPW